MVCLTRLLENERQTIEIGDDEQGAIVRNNIQSAVSSSDDYNLRKGANNNVRNAHQLNSSERDSQDIFESIIS
jgi:hypothetical protein